jgi:hypothetical protein
MQVKPFKPLGNAVKKPKMRLTKAQKQDALIKLLFLTSKK